MSPRIVSSGSDATAVSLGSTSPTNMSSSTLYEADIEVQRRSYLIGVLDIDVSNHYREVEEFSTKAFSAYPLGVAMHGADLAHGQQNAKAWDDYWDGVQEEMLNPGYWSEPVSCEANEAVPASPLKEHSLAPTTVSCYSILSLLKQDNNVTQKAPRPTTQTPVQKLEDVDPAIVAIGRCVTSKSAVSIDPVPRNSTTTSTKYIYRAHGPPVGISSGIQTHKKKSKPLSSACSTQPSKKASKAIPKQRKKRSKGKAKQSSETGAALLDAMVSSLGNDSVNELPEAQSTHVALASSTKSEGLSYNAEVIIVDVMPILPKLKAWRKQERIRQLCCVLQALGSNAMKNNSILVLSTSAFPPMLQCIMQPPVAPQLQISVTKQILSLEASLQLLKQQILRKLLCFEETKASKRVKSRLVLHPATVDPSAATTSVGHLLRRLGEKSVESLMTFPVQPAAKSGDDGRISLDTVALDVSNPQHEQCSSENTTTDPKTGDTIQPVANKAKGTPRSHQKPVSEQSQSLQGDGSTKVSDAVWTHKKKQKQSSSSAEHNKYLKKITNGNKTTGSCGQKNKKKKSKAKATESSQPSASSTSKEELLLQDELSSPNISLLSAEESKISTPSSTTEDSIDGMIVASPATSHEEFQVTYAGSDTTQEVIEDLKQSTESCNVSMGACTNLMLYRPLTVKFPEVEYEVVVEFDFFRSISPTPFSLAPEPQITSAATCTDLVLCRPSTFKVPLVEYEVIINFDFFRVILPTPFNLALEPETTSAAICTDLVICQPLIFTPPLLEHDMDTGSSSAESLPTTISNVECKEASPIVCTEVVLSSPSVCQAPGAYFGFGTHYTPLEMPSATFFSFECDIASAEDSSVPKYSRSITDILTKRADRAKAIADFLSGAVSLPSTTKQDDLRLPEPLPSIKGHRHSDSHDSGYETDILPQVESPILPSTKEDGPACDVDNRIESVATKDEDKAKTMALVKLQEAQPKKSVRFNLPIVRRTPRGTRAVSFLGLEQRRTSALKAVAAPKFKAPHLICAPQPVSPSTTMLNVLGGRPRRVPFTIYFFPELDASGPAISSEPGSPILTADSCAASSTANTTPNEPTKKTTTTTQDSNGNKATTSTQKPSIFRWAWSRITKSASMAWKAPIQTIVKPAIKTAIKGVAYMIVEPILHFTIRWVHLLRRGVELWFAHHPIGF